MTRAAIPFALPQESGYSELGGAQAFAANVMVDKNGVVTRRPGLGASSLYDGVIDSEGLSAVHVTASDAVYAVGGGALNKRIYRLTGSFRDLTGDPDVGQLYGSGRPVIAETEAMLAMTAGNSPLKVLFSDDSVSALANVPAECTHIIAQNSRLLINDNSSKGLVWYSGQALGSSTTGHETWTGLSTGFFSHEARPDPMLALHENTNEVFGFGSSSLQVWNPDAQTAYAASATREYGTSARYSVVKREQSFYWLDQRKRFVVSDGRSAEVISGAIQQSLNDISTVMDAWGFWFHEGIADCLVWVFPTARRCFAYQIGRGWSEWFGLAGANWGRINLGCVAERPYGGKTLAGTLDGRVALLTRSSQTDLGESVTADIRTGFLNNGTDAIKHCLSVTMNLRRGTTSGSTSPVAWLSYRDGPGEAWRRVAVSLGSTNQALSVVRLPGFGTYRRRQWRFEFSESDLELVSAEEEFTVNEV